MRANRISGLDSADIEAPFLVVTVEERVSNFEREDDRRLLRIAGREARDPDNGPQGGARRADHSLISPRAPAESRPGTELDELTEAEREVLKLLTRGQSNREIARTLIVSDATVKTHVAHVLMKLGVRDRVQAVIYAYESGLIQPGRSSGLIAALRWTYQTPAPTRHPSHISSSPLSRSALVLASTEPVGDFFYNVDAAFRKHGFDLAG